MNQHMIPGQDPPLSKKQIKRVKQLKKYQAQMDQPNEHMEFI